MLVNGLSWNPVPWEHVNYEWIAPPTVSIQSLLKINKNMGHGEQSIWQVYMDNREMTGLTRRIELFFNNIQ